jgi:TolB protein
MLSKDIFRYPSGLGCIVLSLVLSSSSLLAQTAPPALGLFQDYAEVGALQRAGSARYDSAHHVYTVTASGDSIGSTSDAFHLLSKQVSGEIALTADIDLPEKSRHPQGIAVLMIRQSLDADSVFAAVALSGEGLASMQFRDAKGSIARKIESNLAAPRRLRIEKRGDFIYVFLASAAGGPLHPSGASIKLSLQGSFYVGLGVCSHDKNAVEKAIFSNVGLAIPAASAAPPVLYSTLETVSITSTDRRVIYSSLGHFEAPNWSRDGSYFVFNRDGHILRLPSGGGTPLPIDTGPSIHCNNDHGISPDGTRLAISDQSQPDQKSSVYIVPIGGGQPRRITENSPSYWHGWSPDGKTLAFVGQRNGEFDIYTIPVIGGAETRMTTAKGLDDGPEFSPDGEYIYFNSERTGHMQIWRMRADGADQEQITFDELNNWFPHISPDGKWMVFLSYGSEVTGHPPNKDVELRLTKITAGKIGDITILAKLFGGQGTINVPSWSPESQQVAFVSYQLLPAEEAEIK